MLARRETPRGAHDPACDRKSFADPSHQRNLTRIKITSISPRHA
jgi:hypothetical protein